MSEDLKPRIIDAGDEAIFERGTGKVLRVTRVRYMLGELGPFTADFSEGTLTEFGLEQAMRAKAESLRRFV
jgi:hypothetical protein